MGLVLTGTLISHFSQEKTNRHGEPYTRRAAKVFTGRDVEYVDLPKNFDLATLPAEGEEFSIEVTIEPWATKEGKGRYSLTGWRVITEGTRKASVSVVS